MLSILYCSSSIFTVKSKKSRRNLCHLNFLHKDVLKNAEEWDGEKKASNAGFERIKHPQTITTCLKILWSKTSAGKKKENWWQSALPKWTSWKRALESAAVTNSLEQSGNKLKKIVRVHYFHIHLICFLQNYGSQRR